MSFGSKPKTTTTTSQVKLSPQQQQLLDLVIPKAETFINNPVTLPPGSTIPQPNPLQVEGQSRAVGSAAGPLSTLAGNVADAANFNLSSVLSPSTNPFLREAAVGAIRPLVENFRENVIPGIESQALSAGQFGGSRQGIAEGIAARGLGNTIADTTSKIFSDAFNKGLDQQARTLGLLPQINSQILSPATTFAAVGGQNFGLEKARLEEALNRAIFEQVSPFNAARDVANIALSIPSGSTTTSTAPIQRSNPFLSGLGGAAAGASIGSSIPAIGTGLGAGVGGLIGILGSLF